MRCYTTKISRLPSRFNHNHKFHELFSATKWWISKYTPENWRLELENHPFEKENHLNQTSILGLQLLVFGGVSKVYVNSGQISIIPKPEWSGDLGEVPLLNHHLGWLLGGKRRYNLPRCKSSFILQKHSITEPSSYSSAPGPMEFGLSWFDSFAIRKLVGGWINQLKNMRKSNWKISQGRGEKKEYLKPPPRKEGLGCIYSEFGVGLWVAQSWNGWELVIWILKNQKFKCQNPPPKVMGNLRISVDPA